MTRVDFIFNVSQKQQKTAEIVTLLLNKGRRVMLHFPDEASAEIIAQGLWQSATTSFLPNCPTGDGVAQETAIHLHWEGQPIHQHDILINFNTMPPPFFSRFGRLIEIVSQDDEDKKYARERFKFYRDRGYEIRNTDALAEPRV